MVYIIGLLTLLTLGSAAWTLIQIIKPSWFFKAEEEANLKRVRPKWYLFGGIFGIACIILLWLQAFQLKLTSVWIFTGIMTLGSLKPLGMVFFYVKFSNEATRLVHKMQASKNTYTIVVLARGILTIVLLMATLYFMGTFGTIQ